MKILEISGSIASIISLIVALYFQWQGKPETQRNLAIATGAVFLIVTVIAYFKRRKSSAQVSTTANLPQSTPVGQVINLYPSEEHVSKQVARSKDGELSGVIRMCIPRGSAYDVFYKKPFKRHPHLEIQREPLTGVIEITSQRKDGFKIVSSDGMPMDLKWKAEGELED